MSESCWSVYIIRCGDGSLYTGIATDVERRFGEHVSQGPKAAKYLRGRLPLEIVYRKEIGSRSEASKEELRIKRMGVKGKVGACEWRLIAAAWLRLSYDGEQLRIDAADACKTEFGKEPPWENVTTITEDGADGDASESIELIEDALCEESPRGFNLIFDQPARDIPDSFWD
jgi:putative endonuclease